MIDKDYRIVLVWLNDKQIKQLPSNIIWIKRTSNVDELVTLYTRSNVFVNPSKEETFSLVTVEAMACKAKVIVLDTSAVKELVDEETGIVLSDDGIENYLDAIYKLSDKKISDEKLEKILDKYDKDKQIEKIFDLCDWYVCSDRTLLLTWTIAPNNWITKFNYKNSLSPEKRLREYENSLKYYIEDFLFEKIVFCENSNYDCENWKKEMTQFAKENNKSLEIIQFSWNVEKTLELSYSYGEWECIDYAFDNSKLLKESTNRWKITWRYIIKNINDIVKSSDKYENLLFKWLRPLWFFAIDTSIFKVSNEIYKQYLYNAKNDITKENNKCIENIFYDRIRNQKISFWKIKVLPKKDGYRDAWHEEKWYHHVLLYFWLWSEWNIIGKMLDTMFYARYTRNIKKK